MYMFTYIAIYIYEVYLYIMSECIFIETVNFFKEKLNYFSLVQVQQTHKNFLRNSWLISIMPT